MKPFPAIEPERILAQDDLFLVALDKFPVSEGHVLIIVKRVVSRFQDLTTDEKARITHWISWCESHLDRTLRPKPDAFNIGINDGLAAGQTVGQLHVHIIPRYKGDVPDPRGGVRFVIPSKARYRKMPQA